MARERESSNGQPKQHTGYEAVDGVYGSVAEKAKKANDYGVPYSIVRYYETEDPRVARTFDSYEVKVFNRIKDVLR